MQEKAWNQSSKFSTGAGHKEVRETRWPLLPPALARPWSWVTVFLLLPTPCITPLYR